MHTAHEVAVATLGITLNLRINSFSQARCLRAQAMFNFLALIARYFRSPAEATPISPAMALMESADERAGQDAHHAQELRVAASAFLSVVR